jgi:hypothetical protein
LNRQYGFSSFFGPVISPTGVTSFLSLPQCRLSSG